jgi:putative ABC transport system substrate-binding protein
MEEPGGNISGASNVVPLATQIQTAKRLFPIKKLGLLFNPREKNAMIQRDQLAAIARKEGFEVVDFRSPPALDMLQQNLQGLADGKHQVDVMYLPADSFLISQAKLIGPKLRDANIKSIGSVKTYVTAGALMGMVPDYHELGVSVAKILDRNRKGEPLARIPVQATEEPTLVINEQTRAKLGIAIPKAILSKAEVVK